MKTIVNEKDLARSSDWDQYWSLDQTKRFTQISWSKRRMIRIIAPFMREGTRALDAGCGSGFFSKYFCEQGLATTALDYSPQALAIARQLTKGKVDTLQKDLTADDLSGEMTQRYDIIFSDGLLEHFSSEHQEKILRNFFNLLSPAGRLITFVPNRWSPWELVRPFYMPGIDEKPFVLSQLIALNQRNGFEVIARGGINTFPFALSPDAMVGQWLGMLLFTVAKKK